MKSRLEMIAAEGVEFWFRPDLTKEEQLRAMEGMARIQGLIPLAPCECARDALLYAYEVLNRELIAEVIYRGDEDGDEEGVKGHRH